MKNPLSSTIDILSNLVSFKSVSGTPTHDILNYISGYLTEHGVQCSLSYDEAQERANLFATIGPAIDGGVVLNGHTDVVPVDGQSWASDPFTLTQKDDRLYGRGAVDMKGFLACVLASVPLFQTSTLKYPIHIAFSFDEEIGGLGMPVLLNSLSKEAFRPRIVIVGEPTEMKLVTGHKGGYEMRTEITGFEVHSCNPTIGVNAITAATKLITKTEEIAARLRSNPDSSSPFEPPYSTINIGTIEGGTARNATAGWCHFNWEIRPMPGENCENIINELEDYATEVLLPPMKAVSPAADINMITEVKVPPLDDSNADEAAAFISDITGLNSRNVVSFGTDAGYFSDAHYSTVVFGPGSLSRAHKPDEYIRIDELDRGLEFLKNVAAKLS